jgi:hypothetical protein
MRELSKKVRSIIKKTAKRENYNLKGSKWVDGAEGGKRAPESFNDSEGNLICDILYSKEYWVPNSIIEDVTLKFSNGIEYGVYATDCGSNKVIFV